MKQIKIKKTNEILYYDKLTNGLEVYILPNNNQKNYYITYSTKYGSINTEFKTNTDKNYIKVPNGIAHYLEHLMFNMPDGNAFDYFSKLGSNVNAFTSYNVTCYEVFSSNSLKENLSYLIKYVNTPYFTKEMIDKEREIITEEIKMYDNNPNTELTYGTYRNIFIKDKRNTLISGSIEDIKKITVKDLENCYNTFYNPNNMFIILTGNIDPYESISIINETFKNIKTKNIEITNKLITEPNKVKEKYIEKNMSVEIPKISISYKIPRKIFTKLNITEVELKLYITIIFKILFGITSDLQDKLISSKIIPNGIHINKTYTKEHIIISIMTETNYPETFIKEIDDTLNNNKIEEIDLKRIIKVFKSNYILHFDDIEYVNNNIQDNIIEYNTIIDNYMEIYEKLNIDTLNKIIKLLNMKEKSIFVIKPNKNKNID